MILSCLIRSIANVASLKVTDAPVKGEEESVQAGVNNARFKT